VPGLTLEPFGRGYVLRGLRCGSSRCARVGILAPVTLWGARFNAGAVGQGLRVAQAALAAAAWLGAGVLVLVTLWGARVSAGAVWLGFTVLLGRLAAAGGPRGILAPVTLRGARVSAGTVWQGLRAAGAALAAAAGLGGGQFGTGYFVGYPC